MGQRIKNSIVYRGAVLLFAVINAIPRKCALFIGEMLGLAAYLVIRKERIKALTNIDRAYRDEMTYRRKREIVRRSFITFGRSTVEIMRMRRHFRAEMRPDIEIVGLEKFKTAYSRGRGVVAFTGHIGNFELLAAWVSQNGFKTAVIGRELYDKRLDKMIVANRTELGMINVRTDDSPRRILRLLRDGYAIGFLIDTDSHRVSGELTPFYGRLAKTPTGPTELGLLSGAAFLPMFCLSFPGGRYKLIFGDELAPESRERSRENVYRITSRMTRIIEDLIREYPEQWIWMHNRWNARPDPADADFLQSVTSGQVNFGSFEKT